MPEAGSPISSLAVPSLMGLHGKALINASRAKMFDEEQHLHIVMWFADGGDLFSRIEKASKGIPEKQCQFIFRQLFLAMEYMHSQHVAHRDIKAENILLADDSPRCLVRIGDFGSVLHILHTGVIPYHEHFN